MITPYQFAEMQARLNKSVVRQLHEAVEIEDDLANDVFYLCRDRGWGLIQARTDKRSTIAEGAHDCTIFASGGRFFCFELKSRTGKSKPKQLAWAALLRHNGHTVHVVRSMQEVREIIL